MPKTEIRGPWPYEINPGPRVVTRRLLTQPILDYLKKHPGGHIPVDTFQRCPRIWEKIQGLSGVGCGS